MIVSTWNYVTFIQFHTIVSNITYIRTFEKYASINTKQIIEYFVTHYQIRFNSSTV